MTRPTRRGALVARYHADDSERGSLPFLMLVMIIIAALGAVLLNTVVSQARTTRFDESRVRSIDAAQSGLDYALARLRGAVKTTGSATGDAGALPCWGTAGVDETDWKNVSPDQSQAVKFTVRVQYFHSDDPSTLTEADRTAKQMRCSPGNGPYDVAKQSRAPRYALIRSTAAESVKRSSSSKGRTVETTYVFRTNDVTISGGQIRVYPASADSATMCMDAGSDNPAVGTPVKLAPCSGSNPPAESQVFTYRSDLSIELVSSAKQSTGTSTTPGLCLDTNPTSHQAGRTIVLNRCSVADENPGQPDQTFVCPAGETPTSFKLKYPSRTCKISPYNQQWSVDDNAHLRGAKSDQTDVDGFCIDAASQSEGTTLLLQACAGGTTDAKQTWVPFPTVGAGAAGWGNDQIVNYAQFATCIDATGQNPDATYMILYTCKQNPDPSKVNWNQRLKPSVALDKTKGPKQVQLRTTAANGTTYCLRTPGTEGGYVRLQSCLTSGATDITWTVNQRVTTDGSTAELAYRDRYTITDRTGRCLAPGPNSDMHSGQYYKLVLSTCDGSTYQKWNADPSDLEGSLTNTREIVE